MRFFGQAELNGRIDAILPEMTEPRRELHRLPGIAGGEFKTSAPIRDFLQKQDRKIPPFFASEQGSGAETKNTLKRFLSGFSAPGIAFH